MIRAFTISSIISLLIFITPLAIKAQDDNGLFDRSLPDQDTVKVRVGFSVINITDIIEKDENIVFDAIINMAWKDERLAYEFDSADFDFIDGHFNYRRSPKVMYLGDFQVKELFEGWRPHFLVANGVGNRNISNMSIKIWPDGTCVYNEEFSCVAETPMDLKLYPFDKQELDVFIYPQGHRRSEMMFIVDESLEVFWNRNLGIADWDRLGVDNREKEKEMLFEDGSIVLASEIKTTIKVKRKPLHILVGILLPMIILVCLTWSVFWLNKQSVSERINISFIGILSVITYYLVIQDSVPEISYLTFTDVFVVLTFVLLAASVVESLLVESLDKRGLSDKGDRLDKFSRWLFPLVYFSFTGLIYLFYSYVL